MGSTDSASSAHDESSCGLVRSLFSSSCRGRAEAFAKRLHHRLTSLSGENTSLQQFAEINKPCETSWLHPSSSSNNGAIAANIVTNNHIFQHQPRHNLESDIFCDLDIQLEEKEERGETNKLGLPVEEPTHTEFTHLLMNPGEILKVNHHDTCHCSPNGTKTTTATGVHQDPESSYTYMSPIIGTPLDSDSSEFFFDPESSDMEKQKSENFFDPITTSDSEVTSNLCNYSIPMKAKVSSNNRRTSKNSKPVCEDTSESESCSSRRNPTPTCETDQQNEPVGSSEDSLNGRSSQETTSLSHESLWSTFDDSTTSLQDDSPLKNSCPVLDVSHISLPKSHSDSELPNKSISVVESNKMNKQYEEDQEIEHNVDQVDFVNIISKSRDTEDDIDKGANENLCNDIENLVNKETDIREFIDTIIILPNCSSQLETENTVVSDSDTDQSSYGSAINNLDALPLECQINIEMTNEPIVNNEMKSQTDNDTIVNISDNAEKMYLLPTKLNNDSNTKEDEDDSSLEQKSQNEIMEEEKERPLRIRRCSSLKTGKTPPNTPCRKKIVRFADVLGLDLAAVRTFLDEIPRIPNSAYNDLIFQKEDIFQKENSPVSTTTDSSWSDSYSNNKHEFALTTAKIDRILMPLFQQPSGMVNFLDLVRERYVCLENALVQDPVTLSIQGTVRVLNFDFHKSVHVRYTFNSWRSFNDLQATYVSNSCDGFSDKFSFVLYCQTLQIGQKLELAIRFQCKGAQYWDNNGGANYCFQCLSNSSSTGYIPIIVGEDNRHTDWSQFY